MATIKNIKIYFILLLSSLIFSAAVYYFKAALADGRYIEPGSIEYYVLVPAVIKQLPLDPADQIVSYYYSSADGDNPAVVSVAFSTVKPIGRFYEALVDYFDTLGFQNVDAGYKKDAMEISITHSVGDDDAIIINVALLEYLH